jgi:hypothetical protein
LNRRDDYLISGEQAFQGQHQLYSLNVPSAPSSAVADILSFEGDEAIGQESRYTIQFTHTSHDLSQREYLTACVKEKKSLFREKCITYLRPFWIDSTVSTLR